MQVQSKTGGEVGNSRLTSLVGLLLLGLLFLEGLTIPLVHRLLAPHVFIGLLLIPPIALKLGSTGYRFAVYYGGNRRYRAIGPPPFLLRVGAPFLILTTVLVFASGIAAPGARPPAGGYLETGPRGVVSALVLRNDGPRPGPRLESRPPRPRGALSRQQDEAAPTAKSRWCGHPPQSDNRLDHIRCRAGGGTASD